MFCVRECVFSFFMKKQQGGALEVGPPDFRSSKKKKNSNAPLELAQDAHRLARRDGQHGRDGFHGLVLAGAQALLVQDVVGLGLLCCVFFGGGAAPGEQAEKKGRPGASAGIGFCPCRWGLKQPAPGRTQTTSVTARAWSIRPGCGWRARGGGRGVLWGGRAAPPVRRAARRPPPFFLSHITHAPCAPP